MPSFISQAVVGLRPCGCTYQTVALLTGMGLFGLHPPR